MSYRRSTFGEDVSSQQLQQELERIEQALDVSDIITFKQWHEEPSKLREGMTLLADGTDWDPGSGQGVYTYYAGAWHKLG